MELAQTERRGIVPTEVEPLPETALCPGFDVEARTHDDGLTAFARVRRRLLGIAYRVLGNAAEAEDVVQDVWLQWQSTNRSVIINPAAFLATTTKRLCINVAQSARSRRETYVGTWLPEPVDTGGDPGLDAERSESLRLAVLVLLQRLSPAERAAYILREAFDYSHRQIADILQIEEANTRQLVSRARKRIADCRRKSPSSDQHRRLLDALVAATQNGEMAALKGLLTEDVVSVRMSVEMGGNTAHDNTCWPATGLNAPQFA